MQAWKIKKKAASKPASKLKTRLLGVLFIVATLGAAFYDFPQLYNATIAKAGAPVVSESPFRLGLDLQGGTHLVYEADMSEIDPEDRLEALEGVRDVIERRVNAFGVAEPVVQTVTTGGVYRVIIELAGVLNTNEAIDLIGETPVLEFKELGDGIGRDLTEEEQLALEEAQGEERAAADEVLARALRGENFNGLVAEHSIESGIDEHQGIADGLSLSVPIFAPVVQAIIDTGTRVNGVVPQVVETDRGLEIIKFLERRDEQEWLASHILKCFEGKTNCANPIPAIDASVQMNNLKEQATAENFAELARTNSDDQGLGDGDLGWIIRGETVQAFELQLALTPVGEISDVVETEFGYHLIHKRDERQVTVYDVQRVIMPLSGAVDIADGDISPWVNTELSGKHLDSSAVEFDPNTGVPYVALRFSPEGGDLFGDLTASHIGQPIAIFLDGEPISTPVVQQAIHGGQAVITGDFSVDEAKILAQRLNAGALPVPIDLLSQQTVGPTLGAISLEKSIQAALIGFVLVALFMILVYRIPGLIAVLALVLFALINLAAYRLFGVTITLAGIAGFVLSIGIAVDANVLIIERIKEEYEAGRDFNSAVKEGFARAWTAIRDGNVTTVVAAAVLFWFSSSFIRGFALTLAIGVGLSMFTAIVVTRAYFENAFEWKALRSNALTGFKKN